MPPWMQVLAGLFGVGGLASAVVGKLMDGRATDAARARDLLWSELGTLRAQLSALQAKVELLQRQEHEYLRKIGTLELSNEALAHKLTARDAEARLAEAELAALRTRIEDCPNCGREDS